MRIKENCTAGTEDFWYDLSCGGYLKPENILENEEDIVKVKEAIEVLMEFESSCEESIEGFLQ